MQHAPPRSRDTLRQLEAKYCVAILKECHGHKGAACQVLGITRPTLNEHLAHAKPQAKAPEVPA